MVVVEPELTPSIYVGQRELAVVSPADQVEILGSDSASTCLLVLLRHPASGVAGLAHLDTLSEDSEDSLDNQLVQLLEATSQRINCEDLQLEVSLFGGYNDEAGLSSRLSSLILRTLHTSTVSFLLRHLCCADLNTLPGLEGPRPAVWGGGLNLSTGEVFAGEFRRRGPDMDIRSLGLYSRGQKHLGRTLQCLPSLFNLRCSECVQRGRQDDDDQTLHLRGAQRPGELVQQVRLVSAGCPEHESLRGASSLLSGGPGYSEEDDEEPPPSGDFVPRGPAQGLPAGEEDWGLETGGTRPGRHHQSSLQ